MMKSIGLLSLTIGSALLSFSLAQASTSPAEDVELVFSDADIAASTSNEITISSSLGGGIPRPQKYRCKCYPGDRCYPSDSAWGRLNQTVGGNLQVALPPGAPCYNSLRSETGVSLQTFDQEACREVQENWVMQQWNTDHPISNLWTFWTNDTCLPFPPTPASTCTRGYYGNYVVLAKTRQHVKATIDFARQNNVRLVIRNTGHDIMGRSTGYGALILNTHAFKDVEFIEKWKGPGGWRGGAVKVGAGVQGRELWRLANQRKPPQAIVTGECPTVGFAGGYIQGGGHGPLATFYGMAADQALSFDVVTASGQYLTASAGQNKDLFWALKGGGPSTFAAVLSVTVKTFPDLPSAAVILDLNFTHTTDLELYWKGVDAFHGLSNHYVDHGLFVYYELMPLRLHVQPFVGPNMTAAQLDAVVQPLFDKLDAEGVPYSRTTKDFKTFFDLYIDIFEDETAAASMITGGRIFTRKDFERNATAINAAQRLAVEQPGSFTIGHIVGPGTGAPVVDNAIHPKWREASSFSISSINITGAASLEEKAEVQRVITDVMGRAMREASPNGAAYVNEGDLEEPNWQESYWGSNYPRLYMLKQRYDPLGVFYARTTPGTEDWDVIDYGTKLCKGV